MLIAITGPNGLLGREVAKVFKKEYDVIELPHDILDITNLNQVREVLSSYMPTVLVNCAAYTAVDKAEEEPKKANWLMAWVSETLPWRAGSSIFHWFT